MIEAGVATLEVADVGQAGAVDADPGSPAGRRVGNHVAAEQTEHGADLVIAEILGQIAPVETAEALAAPDKVRKKPLAGAGGECVQRGRLARGSMLAQIFIELRLVADHGFSARLLLLPLGGQGRSEEHTSELQSLMRISYAVFC